MKNQANFEEPSDPASRSLEPQSRVGLIIGIILALIAVLGGLWAYLVFQTGEKPPEDVGQPKQAATTSDFINQPGSGDRPLPPHDPITINPELKGQSAPEAYRVITNQ
ncbi:MAG: hypothetical protein UT11_C0005G0004 [Berkelbacteria bacterium GW2011_GWA2_38_9]|uniref:Uncharacterized protein n=1 Tax=Berkelbacteria bacterium GW2011_GWA2_38_9 TaxID=1618334 RepID=A0A0G0LEZ7_9BACT|nr:MAG: hypothetical protein UT11_C0005G0004 [Berkelbacteria bacterium GW2011_GWA2_38_9]